MSLAAAYLWMLGIGAGAAFLLGVAVMSLHELAERRRPRLGHFGERDDA